MTTINKIGFDTKAIPADRAGLRRIAAALLHLGSAERKMTLIVMDLTLLSVSLIIAVVLRTTLLPDLTALLGYFKWFVTLTVLWIILSAIFDVYNLARAANTTAGPLAAAGAAICTSLIYLAIPWLTPSLENRTQAFIFVFLTTIGIAGWRLLYARLFAQPAFRHSAIIVGAGLTSQVLARTLQTGSSRQEGNPLQGAGHTLLGFVDDDLPGQGEIVAGLPVLGGSSHLVRLVRTLGVDEIIVSQPCRGEMCDDLFEAVLDCRELGIPVHNIVTLYEDLTGRVAVEYAGHNIEMTICKQDAPFTRFYRLTKRLTDLAGGVIGLIGVIVVAAPVMVINALTSPGPLFYRQQRVGWGGRPLTVLKFRSMVPNAEKQKGVTWAAEDDDRVTPAGRWLRRTHLDELPQVINVLRGEMSLVGPRPERPEFVGELTRQMPLYRARHCVRPGITGWAQIHQDYGDSVESSHEKLEYDLFYVKYAGLLLDCLIILRTIAMVLGLHGR
jgi:exopolysaccharide biosynthesis polyprenyl glycosylphosphotransferase